MVNGDGSVLQLSNEKTIENMGKLVGKSLSPMDPMGKEPLKKNKSIGNMVLYIAKNQ